MNRTNRSNFTSLSFTVEDDLISQASVSTYIGNRNFPQNPFSKNYQIKGLDKNNSLLIQENMINGRKNSQKVRGQAHNEAYKQLNNEMYNPFEHKLQGGFMPKQENLYQKQKQRQIQFLKRKEQQQLNNNRNYKIVFNANNQKTNNTLKLAANNVLNNQQNFNIRDYYNKNIKSRKQIQQITEEQDAQSQDENQQKKYSQPNRSKNNNNFNLKQNNHKANDYSRKQKRNDIEYAKKQQMPASQSAKDVQNKNRNQVLKTSIQKPKSSKQIKKPVNNFINHKAQNKLKVPPNKIIPKNLSKQQSQKTGSNPNLKKKYSEVYEGADRNLVEQIQNQIAQQTNVTFQEIAELQNAKSLLQEAIILPKIMPEFFKGIRKAMKGILMFGPPGTGKTLLAKAVANSNMFFNVSASSLASKWKGQSEKMVRILFEMARYHSPSIIFFDQIDAIASKRSQNQHQSSRKVKTELLVQMDGVQSSEHQVFVLAATNRPWDLDEALRRRLQKRIYIPLPEKQGRKKMFQINLKQIKLSSNITWDRVVKQTSGYSGADISNICRDAAYMPMRRMLAKVGIQKIGQINQKQLLDQELSEKDLIEAVKNNKPSVNNDDLKKYQKWMKQFGSQ